MIFVSENVIEVHNIVVYCCFRSISPLKVTKTSIKSHLGLKSDGLKRIESVLTDINALKTTITDENRKVNNFQL